MVVQTADTDAERTSHLPDCREPQHHVPTERRRHRRLRRTRPSLTHPAGTTHRLLQGRIWKLFVYIGKNPRFTAFLDSYLHTRLAIVTANELGLAFPPRNLPQKIRPDPSTFYLVIVVTDKQTNRQTDRQTNVRR